MGAISTAKMTFEEFEQLPDEPYKLELLQGELTRMPPPEKRHNRSAYRLAKLLDAALEKLGAGVGQVEIEMGYRLSDRPSWLIPDVSLSFPDQPGDKYLEGSPMIAFEIVSPSNTAAHLDRKIQEYFTGGALEVWIIYPDPRHAWVYVPDAVARREDRGFRSTLLPGVEIPFEAFL